MSDDAHRLPPPDTLRQVAEAVLLFLTVLAPWPFACVEGPWEALLFAGVLILTSLWIAHAVICRRSHLRPDVISVLFVALILLTLVQLMPLPASVVGIVSSSRVQLERELMPAVAELLPGETVTASESGSWMTITTDVNLTRIFLARIVGLFLLYLVVRNWIVTRDAFRRIAWATAGNAVALAIFAIAQYFSSPTNTTLFWSVQTDGAVFGPFVCRNHYPDFILFGLGLGVAVMVSRKSARKTKVRGVEYSVSIVQKLSDSPDLFALILGLIIVLMSIPLSLSRGGVLSTVVAGAAIGLAIRTQRGRLSAPLAIGAVVLVAALGAGIWFGGSTTTDRLSTLGESNASLQRTDLWRGVVRQIPAFLALGGGNGAVAGIEPLGRVDPNATSYIVNHVHNEYLEAIIEGGLVRLALTLLFAAAAIRLCLRTYARLKDRSTGPLVLGVLFGIIGLVVHSVVDFGLHIPAIAFLATVLLGFVGDAATDPAYIPVRKGSSTPPPAPDAGRYTLRGPALAAMALILMASALLCFRDAVHRGQAFALMIAARDAQRFAIPNQYRLRIEVLTEAVALTPGDGEAWLKLAQAQFDAARDDRRTAMMGLVGASLPMTMPPDVLEGDSGEHITAGLAAARRARNAAPLLPQPHIFMGIHHAAFTKSEPARVHLERATRCSPTDPQLYTLRGTEAVRRRDMKTAYADWQKAMTLSSSQVAPILRLAKRYLEPDQILTELLPAEPLALATAMEQMVPLRSASNPALRKPYLDRIVSLAGRGDWTAIGYDALARAQAELNQPDAAIQSWQKGLAKDPNDKDVRNRFAAWLELDERYDAAEEQLLWLRDHHPTLDGLQLRLDGVVHARKLQAIIDGR